jgi:hypothetical protein
MTCRVRILSEHDDGMLGLRWQLLPVARFNRLAPKPFPTGPKAGRAFVTTAAGRLVSDRDSHFARGTRCGRDCKPDSENPFVGSVSYVDSTKIDISDSENVRGCHCLRLEDG